MMRNADIVRAIRHGAGITTAKQLGAQLGISAAKVTSVAFRHGYHVMAVVALAWPPRDDALVIDHGELKINAKITAKMTGRTHRAILTRRANLHRRSKAMTDQDIFNEYRHFLVLFSLMSAHHKGDCAPAERKAILLRQWAARRGEVHHIPTRRKLDRMIGHADRFILLRNAYLYLQVSMHSTGVK